MYFLSTKCSSCALNVALEHHMLLLSTISTFAHHTKPVSIKATSTQELHPSIIISVMSVIKLYFRSKGRYLIEIGPKLP